MSGVSLMTERSGISAAQKTVWLPGAEPLLRCGSPGAFDETAVKDPSLVFFENCWHVFYTARGNGEYTTGYVAAEKLTELPHQTRYELKKIRGRHSRYACAPQVFFFEPQRLWYLLFQTQDSNYQPAFSTTKTISDLDSWSDPVFLLPKNTKAKWIDFWIICDDRRAYLFYTQDHKDVVVRTTGLSDYPHGWGDGRKVLSGMHEAVHVYRVKGRQKRYHMIYELNTAGERSFGLARSKDLIGPWEKVTDHYATGSQLSWREQQQTRWTEMASHGELVRTGYNEQLEYDAQHTELFIQGVRKEDYREPYTEIPWVLGLVKQER